ncbi:aspartate carbamoyltransferase catalytic subunit [soil metagenome]
MRQLLDVDELTPGEIGGILRDAARLRRAYESGRRSTRLRGRRVALLFEEPSTRTRLSFEMAARALGAETFVVDPGRSSLVKGETLADTARTLASLGAHVLVLRHHRAGAPWVAARHFAGSVVNAGDGWHAHPTQALVDLFTLRSTFGTPDLRGRKVAIVGDLLHSRVARSDAWALTGDGAEVWACGPTAWLRCWDELAAGLPTGRRLEVTDDASAALRDADVVMALRVQKERMSGPDLSLADYVARYQVTVARMAAARPEALLMHPGPVNEGVEVSAAVARGPHSLVNEQVRNGVPVRMAVLARLAAGGR